MTERSRDKGRPESWSEDFSAGYAAAMLQAARIADGHRAMNLDYGNSLGGVACSSVAAFIVQAAREVGCWDDSLPQPLIPAKSDKEHARTALAAARPEGDGNGN